MHEGAWARPWTTETVQVRSLWLGLVGLPSTSLDLESGLRLGRERGGARGEEACSSRAVAAGLSRERRTVQLLGLEPGVRSSGRCRPCEVLKIPLKKRVPGY